MRRGELVDDRFEVLAFAGAGGMGTVHRARDRRSGGDVALKTLRDPEGNDAARFLKEARVLAALEHPHVVRYVAHGIAPSGEPYLAMEWLDGETLEQRLARGPLSMEQSIELARRVSSALAAAHARGIVHRDVKPSNVFLVNGALADVKLLDFGIARIGDATAGATRTGSVLGTPGYMSPEQVRGDRVDVAPTADVFSLGCVLFEALSGKPAFQGLHAMALLAKLLFEEPPRLSDVRPGIPPALDALVARMLAKDPSARPESGAAVVAQLDALGAAEPAVISQKASAQASITVVEQRLVSIVALAAPSATAQAEVNASATLAVEPLLEALRRVALPLGARVEALGNGVVLALLVGAGNATDQAALGARAALRLRELLSDVPVVLVTGRGEATGRFPVGEALERAAVLLDRAGAELAGPAPIWIDEVTRALVDARFEVVREGEMSCLRGERARGEEVRSFLGKPSPFVGRDRELRNLVELVEESFEENQPRAIVVTGAAGMGKSRLRHELVLRIRESHPDLALALGRSDSIGAGSAFAMAGGALRSALQIAAGEPLSAQMEKLVRVVDRYVEPNDRSRVAEFLGELVGTPFPDDDRPRLRAARQNAQIMADRIQAAYVDFLRGLTAERPTLLLLEDLHWGDNPSVTLVDKALRELEGKRFVVVALARPEVSSVFPSLWSERDVHEIRLGALSKRAAQQLVREVLVDRADGATVEHLVERAGGNAFYLEELIRAVAEGRGGVLPETVLGMVEARLSALDAVSRRVLRAASVFGETFWPDGVLALLGGELSPKEVSERLADLVHREIVVSRPENRFSGQDEYAFRHALLREGAYAMLTHADRTLGHRLAGEWLLKAGEQDAAVLAQHFLRGGELLQAAKHFLDAGEQALRGGDLKGAIARADEGLGCGGEVEIRASLHALASHARVWDGDYEGGSTHAGRAMEIAEPGSTSYCRALADGALHATALQRPHEMADVMKKVLVVSPTPSSMASIGRTFYSIISALISLEQLGATLQQMRRMEEVLASALGRDPLVTAWVEMSRAHTQRYVERDAFAALAHDREAIRQFDIAGDRVYWHLAMVFMGRSFEMLGSFEESARCYEHIAGAPSVPGVSAAMNLYFKCFLLVKSGQIDEGHRLSRSVRDWALARGDRVVGRGIWLVHIDCHLQRGELEAAEREAFALGDPASLPPHIRAGLLSLRAEICLRRGRPEEAARLAQEGISTSRIGMSPRQDALPVLLVESLLAMGDLAQARETLRRAHADMLARAERITDPSYRKTFLERNPMNVRLAALAQAWLE